MFPSRSLLLPPPPAPLYAARSLLAGISHLSASLSKKPADVARCCGGHLPLTSLHAVLDHDGVVGLHGLRRLRLPFHEGRRPHA